MSSVIIIPSRLDAQRLPIKPLAMIGDKPMIQHVFEQALAADIAPVYVATCSEELASVVRDFGGNAIVTDPKLPSGTDRVYAALKTINQIYDRVINVQGDLPFIDPKTIKAVYNTFLPDSDITSVCAPITDHREIDTPSVVKPVLSFLSKTQAKALYFSRSPVPYGATQYYHHIGVYGYRTRALKEFVSLPPSPLELSEKLEQLRALEAGMVIHMGLVETAPIAIDTQEDLEKARLYIKQNDMIGRP